jgi:hypothetical protein
MAKNDKSAKDKQMAARLKAEGDERHTGRCVICGAIIKNGTYTFNHYSAHARGANAD